MSSLSVGGQNPIEAEVGGSPAAAEGTHEREENRAEIAPPKPVHMIPANRETGAK